MSAQNKNDINEGSENQYYIVYQIQINEHFLEKLKYQRKSKPMNEVSKPHTDKIMLDNNKSNNFELIGLKQEFFRSNKDDISESDSIDDSSDDSSISEFEALKNSVSKQENNQTIKTKPSIEGLLQFKNDNTDESLESIIHSQELPNRLTYGNQHLRKIKSLHCLNCKYQNNTNSLQLNSLISLGDINPKRIPTKMEDEICSICLVDYHVNDYIAKLKVCGHVFHKNCIDQWINKPGHKLPNCPVCKSNINH